MKISKRCKKLYLEAESWPPTYNIYRRCQLRIGHKGLHKTCFMGSWTTKHFKKKNTPPGQAITLRGEYIVQWVDKCSDGIAYDETRKLPWEKHE